MSISAINIDGFKSTSLLSGTHKAARFICLVEPPAFAQGEAAFSSDTLAFLCNAAAIPAVNIQTTEEQIHPGASLISHMPYAVTTGELQLRYYIDNNAKTYEFFSAWLRNIVNHGAPNQPFSKHAGYNGANLAEVQYKSHYASTVRLYALDANNDSIMEVVFYDAFPTAMSDVQFDWSTTDDISSFTVTLSYYAYVPMTYPLNIQGGAGTLARTIRSLQPGRIIGTVQSPDEMESILSSITHTLTSSILPGFTQGIRDTLQGSLGQLGRSLVSAATGNAAGALSTIRNLGGNIQNYKSTLQSAVVNQASASLGRALRNFP
jgi:hypothetical protein